MLSNKHQGNLDRGAAAVEMALVLPLLLLVLFGIIDFGRGFNAQMQLTQAAREAVRVKALGGTNGDAQVRVDAATGGLADSPSVPFPTPLVPFPTPLASFPVADCTAGDSNSNAKVTVSYSFEFITPLGPLARFFGVSTLPGIGDFKTLSADGVMRCSG